MKFFVKDFTFLLHFIDQCLKEYVMCLTSMEIVHIDERNVNTYTSIQNENVRVTKNLSSRLYFRNLKRIPIALDNK